MGLEVLLGGGDQLDGGQLEAALLEALDDGADEAALFGRGVLERGWVLGECSWLGGEWWWW